MPPEKSQTMSLRHCTRWLRVKNTGYPEKGNLLVKGKIDVSYLWSCLGVFFLTHSQVCHLHVLGLLSLLRELSGCNLEHSEVEKRRALKARGTAANDLTSINTMEKREKQQLRSVKIIKGSLEEILPSYEKLRSVCAHVRDAKRSRLTAGRVGTLGAAHVRRMCGAVAARFRRVCGAGPRRD